MRGWGGRALPARAAIRHALVVLCCLALGAGAAAAQEFTGYGKATFGSSAKAVRALYPAAREVGPRERLVAPFIGAPHITRLVLDRQTVAGLPKPTLVELRFWKERLWSVIVYFGDNDDQQVLAMLTKRLGEPRVRSTTQTTWEGKDTQTAASAKQRWYSVNDLALSAEAQAWLAEQLKAKPHQH